MGHQIAVGLVLFTKSRWHWTRFSAASISRILDESMAIGNVASFFYPRYTMFYILESLRPANNVCHSFIDLYTKILHVWICLCYIFADKYFVVNVLKIFHWDNVWRHPSSRHNMRIILIEKEMAWKLTEPGLKSSTKSSRYRDVSESALKAKQRPFRA